MRYWTREVGGWFCVACGLFAFYTGYRALLSQHYIFEAIFPLVAGIFLFRGGIHLLKVAVAAEVCRRAQDQVTRESAAPPRRKPVGRPARAGASSVPAKSLTGAPPPKK
jgi:hypothetical protein